MTEYKRLINEAIEARKKSYSPYSNFQVGAAVQTVDGTVYTGCNIENVAFSPTNCAERTAIFKAVSEGHREFLAIAIVGGSRNDKLIFCTPCGVCRQVLAEFCTNSEFEIIIATSESDYKIFKLDDLIPFAFEAEL